MITIDFRLYQKIVCQLAKKERNQCFLFLLCSSLVDKYLENFLERLERAYFTYTERDLFRRIMVQTCSFSPLLDEGEKGCKLMTSRKKEAFFLAVTSFILPLKKEANLCQVKSRQMLPRQKRKPKHFFRSTAMPY